MPRMTHPRRGDVITVPDVLVQKYLANGWEFPQAKAQAAAELKGEALDEALKDAGLPTSGTADEKRARLAEHIANNAEEQA